MTSPFFLHSHVQRPASPFGLRPRPLDVRLPGYRPECEREDVGRRRRNTACDCDCCGSSPPPSHIQQEHDHEHGHNHEFHLSFDYAQRMNAHTIAGPLSAYPASCTHSSHGPKHTDARERTRVTDQHERVRNPLLRPLLGTARQSQPRSRLVVLQQQHLHAHAHHPTPLDLYQDCPICHYHSGQHSPNCPRYKGR